MHYESSLVSEKIFLQSRRTVLLAYPNYTEICEDTIETFDIVTQSLANKEVIAALTADRPMVSSRRRAWDSVIYLHIQYSAGISLDNLRVFFPQALSYWEEYAKYHVAFHATPGLTHKVPHLDLYDDDYWYAIRLTSFAILLGHSDLLACIAALWDYENDDMDGLLERLVAPFVTGRAAPPDECTRHLPYFKLLKVFAAEPEKRSTLMAKYMDEWYEASRRESYYKSHTKGREHNFLGYWSFEAAAVTYVLDIDDSGYRDHEFYPRDLIDFARALPRPQEIGGAVTTTRLRCNGGEPCPRDGFWWTPARPGVGRVFKKGEIMPTFQSDYGLTIWQWSADQSKS